MNCDFFYPSEYSLCFILICLFCYFSYWNCTSPHWLRVEFAFSRAIKQHNLISIFPLSHCIPYIPFYSMAFQAHHQHFLLVPFMSQSHQKRINFLIPQKEKTGTFFSLNPPTLFSLSISQHTQALLFIKP